LPSDDLSFEPSITDARRRAIHGIPQQTACRFDSLGNNSTVIDLVSPRKRQLF
jgi:hypothetical protein